MAWKVGHSSSSRSWRQVASDCGILSSTEGLCWIKSLLQSQQVPVEVESGEENRIVPSEELKD